MIRRPSDALGPQGILLLSADLAPVLGYRRANGFEFKAIAAVQSSTGLFARAEILADLLMAYLPKDPTDKSRALVAAAGSSRAEGGYGPMENYRFLVFTRAAVSDLDDVGPELVLDTLGELTRRFTAEFDIRRLLDHHFATTYERLLEWTDHPDHHVRRLVSEGTRPRLPWTRHFDRFKRDPQGLIVLLHTLRCDTSPYVRLSVANAIGDILKDNPRLGFETLRGWIEESPDDENIRRLVRWAIRYPARKRVKEATSFGLWCS